MPYTIVQHSGYGYAKKPGMSNMTEERSVTGKKQEKAVKDAGGLLFDTYGECATACEVVNGIFDPGMGLYPSVTRGSFSNRQVDGLKVWVPDNADEFLEEVENANAKEKAND